MDFLAKAVGRRKEAVAQVQIQPGTGQFIINNKPAQDYLQNDFYSLLSVKAPFNVLVQKKMDTLQNENKLDNNVSINKENQSSELSVNNNIPKVGDASGEYQLVGNYDLKFDTIVKVKGGGLMGQAEAIRLGIARAICLLASRQTESSSVPADERQENANNPEAVFDNSLFENIVDIRKQFKDKGYLTQDSRVKERRKYGLKKARKASQYHKR